MTGAIPGVGNGYFGAYFVWTLSLEMHALAHPDQPYDPRLSRSVARITGR